MSRRDRRIRNKEEPYKTIIRNFNWVNHPQNVPYEICLLKEILREYATPNVMHTFANLMRRVFHVVSFARRTHKIDALSITDNYETYAVTEKRDKESTICEFYNQLNTVAQKNWIDTTQTNSQPILKKIARDPGHVSDMNIALTLYAQKVGATYVGGMTKDVWDKFRIDHPKLTLTTCFLVHNSILIRREKHRFEPVVSRGLMMHDFLLTEKNKTLVDRHYADFCHEIDVATDLYPPFMLASDKCDKLIEVLGPCGELIWRARLNTCIRGQLPLALSVLQKAPQHWDGIQEYFKYKDHKNAMGQTAYQWLKAQPKVRTRDGREVLANEHYREIFKYMDKECGIPNWKYSAFRFTMEDRDLRAYGLLQPSVLNRIDENDYFNRNAINQAREKPPALEAEETPTTALSM